MNYEYKKILPEEVYVTIFDREATEEELWKGLPRHFAGNRPTGNDFIDLFATNQTPPQDLAKTQ